ncbi:hypothetical protein KOW79_008408 [Hemibagrus wyckioides]|uniref:Uncharacterized protein n=1 Tax=Hemibagrus wyckioides TaxID=337641 RepID=A0A9D3NTS9_9TELE|nr:hypothetical protein KOW79_008408 [Hemibagrus wyckioides]
MLLEGGLQHAASAVLFVAPAVIEEIREDRLQQAGLTASQGQTCTNAQASGAAHFASCYSRSLFYGRQQLSRPAWNPSCPGQVTAGEKIAVLSDERLDETCLQWAHIFPCTG